MKDRKESVWYQHRLDEAKKPQPLTQEERQMMHYQNQAILDDAKRLVEYGIQKGWLKKPQRVSFIEELQSINDQKNQRRLHGIVKNP